MTVDTRTRPAYTWTPRVTVQLTVLAAAAFVYVTAEIVPDPTGAFYLHLNDRYNGPLTEPPPDKADRVILVVRPTGYSKQ